MRPKRKQLTGTVVSNKMNKTIVVKVTRLVRHAVYKRIIKKVSKLKVHDEKNTAQIGDRVCIMETRPVSKDKHWRLAEILK